MILDYYCVAGRNSTCKDLIPGRMFVTAGGIYFHGRFRQVARNIQIPFSAVDSVDLEPEKSAELRKTIRIVASGKPLFFSWFWDREGCFELLVGCVEAFKRARYAPFASSSSPHSPASPIGFTGRKALLSSLREESER